MCTNWYSVWFGIRALKFGLAKLCNPIHFRLIKYHGPMFKCLIAECVNEICNNCIGWSLIQQRIFLRESDLNLKVKLWSVVLKLWVDQSPGEIHCTVSMCPVSTSKRKEDGWKKRAANIWRESKEVCETHYCSFLMGGKSRGVGGGSGITSKYIHL